MIDTWELQRNYRWRGTIAEMCGQRCCQSIYGMAIFENSWLTISSARDYNRLIGTAIKFLLFSHHVLMFGLYYPIYR